MNVLIDTNVAIDYLTQREPFYKPSELIFLASEDNDINGYISATAVTDIFYIAYKILKDKAVVKNSIKELVFDLVKVATVDGSIISKAITSDWNDFEDCVQYYVGESITADYIVTRNPDDFKKGDIKVLSPEELINIIAPE
jgi:predicted nucleic acid-binding protein